MLVGGEVDRTPRRRALAVGVGCTRRRDRQEGRDRPPQPPSQLEPGPTSKRGTRNVANFVIPGVAAGRSRRSRTRVCGTGLTFRDVRLEAWEGGCQMPNESPSALHPRSGCSGFQEDRYWTVIGEHGVVSNPPRPRPDDDGFRITERPGFPSVHVQIGRPGRGPDDPPTPPVPEIAGAPEQSSHVPPSTVRSSVSVG